jgi:hypothetical protein
VVGAHGCEEGESAVEKRRLAGGFFRKQRSSDVDIGLIDGSVEGKFTWGDAEIGVVF